MSLEPAGQPAAPDPADGQVAKSAQAIVYDQWQRPYLTSWRHVTCVAAKTAGGPQAALPGRTVIKSGWLDVHDWRGASVGSVKRSDVLALPAGQVLKGRAAEAHANVYDSAGRRVGVAKVADIVPRRTGR